MNSLRKTVTLAQMCSRQISQSAVLRVTEVPSSKFGRLKEVQKKFQVDDGLPVYLKAGFKDKMLFQGTLLLTAIGLAMSIQVLVILSLPKK